jgi:hypothetical protein
MGKKKVKILVEKKVKIVAAVDLSFCIIAYGNSQKSVPGLGFRV